jgi:hypothetical protein
MIVISGRRAAASLRAALPNPRISCSILLSTAICAVNRLTAAEALEAQALLWSIF